MICESMGKMCMYIYIYYIILYIYIHVQGTIGLGYISRLLEQFLFAAKVMKLKPG